MTRINTNVSSLNAQKMLSRANQDLQTAMTRLSTGLRINSGKDDPAGLIASEALRSDIVSTEAAISNSQRANQMIATADSALGQVSSLLNDIRGLVSEAANTGAMSSDQIAANQLQVDSSLSAIDRISQVTAFQGKRLLDGSLDFTTEGVSNTAINSYEISQANFGTMDEIGVDVQVIEQATKGTLSFSGNTLTQDVVLEVGGSNGYEAFSFAAGVTVAEMATAINLVSDALGVSAEVDSVLAASDGTGSITLSSAGADNDVVVTANAAGADAGNIAIKYVKGSSATATTAAWAAASGDDPATITVSLATSQWAAASATDEGGGNDYRINYGAVGGFLALSADIAGDQYNGTDVTIVIDAGAGGNTAVYDAGNEVLTVTLTAAADATTVAGVINDNLGHLFTATGTNGTGNVSAGTTADVFSSHLGVTGGEIRATAADVTAAINDVGGDVHEYVTAAGTGAGRVTLLSDYAYLGKMNTGTATDLNNYVQLAGGSLGALSISTVNNGASKELSISFQENSQTGGYAQMVVQSTLANASFKVTAKNQGTDYDGVKIRFYDTTGGGPTDVVAWDAQSKEIRVYGDFSSGSRMSADDVTTLISNDIVVGALFEAEVYGEGDGSALVDAIAADANAVVGSADGMAGGELYDSIAIQLATDASGAVTTTAAQLIDYINNSSAEMAALGISASNAGSSTGTGKMEAQSATFATEGVTRLSNEFATGTTNAANGVNAQLTVTSLIAGSGYDDVKITFRDRGSNGISVAYDSAAKELNIYAKATDKVNDIISAFTASSNPTEYYMFQLSAGGGGTGEGLISLTDGGWMSGGTTTVGTSKGVAMTGNWDEGDILGTEGLQFVANEYGSSQFVSVKELTDTGTFNVTDSTGATKTRVTGTDVNARINGVEAVGDGLKVSINTSALQMSLFIDEAMTDDSSTSFTITGGGAQFQLGPDVVSNQQARLGISSVSTATLGGVSGSLYQLRSGGEFSLTANPTMAARIVEESITGITNLRGRLGAFQSTTLETNIDSLSDTLEALTEAESSIRDADFAAESANMTRAQILVQSGISVLKMANSNPQNVLSLLQ